MTGGTGHGFFRLKIPNGVTVGTGDQRPTQVSDPPWTSFTLLPSSHLSPLNKGTDGKTTQQRTTDVGDDFRRPGQSRVWSESETHHYRGTTLTRIPLFWRVQRNGFEVWIETSLSKKFLVGPTKFHTWPPYLHMPFSFPSSLSDYHYINFGSDWTFFRTYISMTLCVLSWGK